MRILVVEDNALLGDGIQAGLRQQGFTVDWVQDGVAASLAVDSGPYAVIVLDLGLPRRSGLDVLKGMRQSRNATPVLILTARDSIEDRVSGLDAGADDYLVKPFDLGELAARLRALIRRSGGHAASTLTIGTLSLDPASRMVTFRNESRTLSAREFDLLHVLMSNAGRVMSRDQLASALYAWGEEIESNAIDVHLHHLRKKLSPDIVQTLRGVGYLMPGEIQ
jgi:two-component system OmpR family response regulator/two-component system response regulator QseB